MAEMHQPIKVSVPSAIRHLIDAEPATFEATLLYPQVNVGAATKMLRWCLHVLEDVCNNFDENQLEQSKSVHSLAMETR